MVVLFDIEWRIICLALLAGHTTEGTCNNHHRYLCNRET